MKSTSVGSQTKTMYVAPFVGAGIEILLYLRSAVFPRVAPFVGAGIEICGSCSAKTA